jgi:hypothetical protein
MRSIGLMVGLLVLLGCMLTAGCEVSYVRAHPYYYYDNYPYSYDYYYDEPGSYNFYFAPRGEFREHGEFREQGEFHEGARVGHAHVSGSHRR